MDKNYNQFDKKLYKTPTLFIRFLNSGDVITSSNDGIDLEEDVLELDVFKKK